MDLQPSPLYQDSQPSQEMSPARLLILLILGMSLGFVLGNIVATALLMANDINMLDLIHLDKTEIGRRQRDLIRWANLLNHVCTFTLPVVAIALATFRRRWATELFLHQAPKLTLTVLALSFMIAAFPLAQFTYWLNLQLPLPESVKEMEEAANRLVEVFLVMDGPAELGLNILAIGVTAAVGEELVFRGMLQPILGKLFRNDLAALWLTAIVFSAIHFQFAGFLPRLVLGAVLGYLFLWSRNLWIPMLTHFAFNTLQILGQYYYKEQMDMLDPEKMEQPHWSLGLASLVLVLAIGEGIRRFQNNNTQTSSR